MVMILSMLRQVPDTVWAALIAAGVAFFTTMLSNRHSRKQLALQLKHSADERDRDRAMALRRDVYLPALEAVARAQGALGQVTNLDVDPAVIGKQMVADLATMSRVHLVAGEGTVRGLLTFQRALMPAYLELITLRVPLAVRRIAIATEQSFIDSALSDHRRFVQMLQQLNLEGSADRAARERINAQIEIAQRTFNEHSEKQASLHREQNAGQLSLAARSTELAALVSQAMPATLIAARQELELPIDAAEYARLFNEQQQDVQRVMREFIARFRSEQGAEDSAERKGE